MNRTILAACLMSACGIASAQAGGNVTVGPSFGFVQAPPGEVSQPNFSETSYQVFIIADFSALAATAGRLPEFPLRQGPVQLDGEQALIEVEGDGVRLPDEQLSLP